VHRLPRFAAGLLLNLEPDFSRFAAFIIEAIHPLLTLCNKSFMSRKHKIFRAPSL